MNNLIISSVANSVLYNGLSIANLSLPIPSNIKSLYWDSSSSKGWIENLDNSGNYIGNTEITVLPDWANQCLTIYQAAIPPQPAPKPAPTPIEACKTQAQWLLQETDWVEIPSVTNTANNPHLTNASEFEAYRVALRVLAVNPVANPTWPTIPTEQWSS